MSCVGCNDGCFDESVQLAQGPAGPAGENGAEGSTSVTAGTDISVTGTGTSGDPYVVNFTGTNGDHNVLFTDIQQKDITNSTYGADPNDPVVSFSINGANENINGVGDIIRFNFMLIGDYQADSASLYDFKISFGGQTILDTSVSTIYQLRKNYGGGKIEENATKVSLDLIVSNTNTLTPVFNQIKSFGDRSLKMMAAGGPVYYNSILSDISVANLASTNTLELSLKSTDGTSNISFMFCEVIKLLKA